MDFQSCLILCSNPTLAFQGHSLKSRHSDEISLLYYLQRLNINTWSGRRTEILVLPFLKCLFLYNPESPEFTIPGEEYLWMPTLDLSSLFGITLSWGINQIAFTLVPLKVILLSFLSNTGNVHAKISISQRFLHVNGHSETRILKATDHWNI